MSNRLTATDLDAIGAAIGRWSPSPPDRTREVLHAAIEALRVTSDDVAAQAIDVVATELADVADRLSVREQILSQALQLAHDQQREIARLKTRVHDLLDLARATRQPQ
jgi:Mg2+ and Co2+ transporter CorA